MEASGRRVRGGGGGHFLVWGASARRWPLGFLVDIKQRSDRSTNDFDETAVMNTSIFIVVAAPISDGFIFDCLSVSISRGFMALFISYFMPDTSIPLNIYLIRCFQISINGYVIDSWNSRIISIHRRLLSTWLNRPHRIISSEHVMMEICYELHASLLIKLCGVLSEDVIEYGSVRCNWMQSQAEGGRGCVSLTDATNRAVDMEARRLNHWLLGSATFPEYNAKHQ